MFNSKTKNFKLLKKYIPILDRCKIINKAGNSVPHDWEKLNSAKNASFTVQRHDICTLQCKKQKVSESNKNREVCYAVYE